MVPFDNLGAVSYSPSIVTILHQFRNKVRYWSKIIHLLLAFHAPLVGSQSEYFHPVWCGKTRMVGLPDAEKSLSICITV